MTIIIGVIRGYIGDDIGDYEGLRGGILGV